MITKMFRYIGIVCAICGFVSCSNEDSFTATNNTNHDGLTRFSAVSDAETRTQMDENGKFYWVSTDKIWVKNGSSYVQSAKTELSDTPANADFYFNEAMGGSNYPVYYTGANSQSATSVTIAADQEQEEPNMCEHFATSGDCGTSTATMQSDGSYKFDLYHRATYLLFTPKLTAWPRYTEWCKISKIIIEKLDDSGQICGTYEFDDNGLNTTSNVTNAGKTITLTCTSDNFQVNTNSTADDCGAYVVMQPGVHKLRITYNVATFKVQKPKRLLNEDGEDQGKWVYEYVDEPQTITKTIDAREYKENTFYRISHKLTVAEPELVYPLHGHYYMWDANSWFWEGVSNYPTKEYFPTADAAPEGYTWTQTDYDMTHNNLPVGNNTSGGRCDDNRWYHRLKQTANASCKDMPNANLMSWYVMKGNVYFDNKTVWLLHTFNNGNIKCNYGIWLKKASVIAAENGKTVAQLSQISAPHQGADYTREGYATDLTKRTPIDNFRCYYDMNRIGKPGEHDSENIDDYFYLPCLGLYEVGPTYYGDNVGGNQSGDIKIEGWNSTDMRYRLNPPALDWAALQMVGVRGFYWTSTYVHHIDTSEQYKYTCWANHDAAYYLQICNPFEGSESNRYIALSWQSYYGRRKGMSAGATVASWFK